MANNQTLHVDFSPTDTVNYNPASQNVVINVVKATPAITWSNPADITYGTALSPTQLNATAPVGGGFVYSPAAGIPLNVGNNQTLHVDFTPTDPANYNNASKDVSINVLKATLTIAWSNPADITYGTALSGTQLNATASVAGSSVYTPASGAMLNAGNNQTLHVDFTPAETASYNNASKNVSINVLKANATITFTGDLTFTYDGSPKPVTATVDPAVSGLKIVYTGVSVTATLDNINYQASKVTATLVINKAPATLAFTGDLSFTYDGSPKPVTATTDLAGLSGVSITYNGSGAAPTNAGSYTVVASLSNANYVALNATGTLVINKATVSIWLGEQTSTYNGSPQPATVATNPAFVSGAVITYTGVSVTYAQSTIAPINVGGYALAATLINPNYEPAYTTGALQILKASQTITFGPVANKAITLGSFTPSATAGSGLPVSFTSLTLNQCTVSVNPTTLVTSVNLLAAGSCTIQASQAGNSNYYAAADAAQSFFIFNPSSSVSGKGTFADPVGKANFSISASYPRRNPVPTGKTTLSVGNLSFSSTGVQLLLSSAVSPAWTQYWGTGTVNGVAGYNFSVTAVIPGTRTYRVRIKIWNNSGVVYDNQPGTPDDAALMADSTLLTSGSLTIK